jgi:capsid protein
MIGDIDRCSAALGDNQAAVADRTDTISAKLSGAVGDLRNANAIAATDLQALDTLSAAVTHAVQDASHGLDIEVSVTGPVEQAIAELSGLCGGDAAGVEEQVKAFAQQLHATYTMSLERDVHHRIATELGLSPTLELPAEAPSGVAAGDDALDALLF